MPNPRIRRLAIAGLAGAAAASAAAPVEISNLPLATSSSLAVKPNFMFLIDDSGSLESNLIPDELAPDYLTLQLGPFYGWSSTQCNGLAFEPDPAKQTYEPPPDADGNPMPLANFNAASSDGFDPKSSKTNLEGEVYYVYTGSEPAMSWKYDLNGVVVDNFYAECRRDIKYPAPMFRQVKVTAGSPEAQRYANWYSYYRVRYTALRSAVGRAVRDMDDTMRVGLASINMLIPGAPVLGVPVWVDIKDFDAAQRRAFYDGMYGMSHKDGTPLRRALSRIGLYYAKLWPGQTYDPVQYACQRNYTLLATDGFWGDDDGGPLNLQRRAVGDQDGNEPRPMKDSRPTSNTLADTAAYYYRTDIRSSALGNCSGALGADVCDNRVPPNADDTANWQHMTTYTVGLGISGKLKFDPAYKTQTSGDFADLKSGKLDWPYTDKPIARIDDLWHAAVNGRGSYTAANRVADLQRAIREALGEARRVATGASIALSANILKDGTGNRAYVPSYRSGAWSGDLKAYPMSGDGKLGDDAAWSAAALLDARDPAERTIWFRKPGGTALLPFDYATLSAQGQGSTFSGWCSRSDAPPACRGYDAATRQQADDGENLVGFLRGEHRLEDIVYRKRESRLGDLINAAPAYVGAPPFRHADAGYSQFQSGAARTPVVYAAANDGMLHAFSADTGKELWAFVPSAVLPLLPKLADPDYARRHRYLLDGTPVVADAYVNGVWRTILVGGLGYGGAGYYALDVTVPEQPALLWEFSDANLGVSVGNPLVFKRRDGSWVVALGSGYNNADGRAHLYLLDAGSGHLLRDMVTSSGTPDAPLNLGRIDAYVTSSRDNTALRVYGGDLQGNLWRFDIDNRIAQGSSGVTRLASFTNDKGAPQPVTTRPKPVLVDIGGAAVPAVFVVTGQYLNNADVKDASVQTAYLVRDDLTTTGLGAVRNSLAALTLAASADGRQLSGAKVDWTQVWGWRVDLPAGGERGVVDPLVIGNHAVFASLDPKGDVCNGGGDSWIYTIDLSQTRTRERSDSVAVDAPAQVVGLTSATTSDDKPLVKSTDITGGTGSGGPPPPPKTSSMPRRSSWRELIDN